MILEEVSIDCVSCDPNQPRKERDSRADEELVLSLKQRGQIVPVIVLASDTGYVLLDGERRFHAAKRLGLTTLRAVILNERPEPSELLAVQLSVNNHRTDINPVDRMHAYRKLMELKQCSASELAAFLGVSKPSITRCLALEKLSPNILKLVAEGQISSSNAYALARMESSSVAEAAQSLLQGELNRQQLEGIASKGKVANKQGPTSRLLCPLPGGVVSLHMAEPLTLDGVMAMCAQVIKAIRKAKREGYDIKTVAQMFKEQLTKTKARVSC
jgi:ParB family chromosome partitioning protein